MLGNITRAGEYKRNDLQRAECSLKLGSEFQNCDSESLASNDRPYGGNQKDHKNPAPGPLTRWRGGAEALATLRTEPAVFRNLVMAESTNHLG